MFDIKKVWKLGAKGKEDDLNTFRWKNLNLLEESLALCWVKNTGKSVFDLHKVRFIDIIKSSDRLQIHKLVLAAHQFLVVCLTVVLLSDKNDLCFELIEKLNDDSEEDNPLKPVLSLFVQKFPDFAGVAAVPDTPTPPKTRQSPMSKKFSAGEEFANPDTYHLLDKLHKFEQELICRRG